MNAHIDNSRPHEVTLARFDSPADLVLADSERDWNSSWMGQTREDSRRTALEGDLEAVAESEAFLTDLDAAIETPRRRTRKTPAGAYYVVPEVIAGLPDPMRERRLDHEGRGPVRIVIDLTASGGMTAAEMRRRSVVVLALVAKLQPLRPVTLTATVALGRGQNGVVACPLGTSPLSLAAVAGILANVGFTRGFAYGYLQNVIGTGGGWCWNSYPTGALSREYAAKMRDVLDLDPLDVFIPPAFYGDPLHTNPAAWLAENVTRLQGSDEPGNFAGSN